MPRLAFRRADHFRILRYHHSDVLDDHPPPHFHAEYQGQDALVDFDGRILEGEIKSATARNLIRNWAKLHRHELEANWRRAKKLQPIDSIAPLD